MKYDVAVQSAGETRHVTVEVRLVINEKNELSAEGVLFDDQCSVILRTKLTQEEFALAAPLADSVRARLAQLARVQE